MKVLLSTDFASFYKYVFIAFFIKQSYDLRLIFERPVLNIMCFLRVGYTNNFIDKHVICVHYSEGVHKISI